MFKLQITAVTAEPIRKRRAAVNATQLGRPMRETDVPDPSVPVTAAARAHRPQYVPLSALRLRFEFDTAHTHARTAALFPPPFRYAASLISSEDLDLSSIPSLSHPTPLPLPPLPRACWSQLRGETRPDDLARRRTEPARLPAPPHGLLLPASAGHWDLAARPRATPPKP